LARRQPTSFDWWRDIPDGWCSRLLPGLGAGLAVANAIRGLLYGVTPLDPLDIVALLACLRLSPALVRPSAQDASTLSRRRARSSFALVQEPETLLLVNEPEGGPPERVGGLWMRLPTWRALGHYETWMPN
jgi:hypothetical protein